MLRIVRKSDKKNQWIPANIYKTSFYNIIEKSGTYVAIYNSASGAIAIGENFPFEVECLPECEIKALVIIPGLFEPPVRTLRATIPENESHIFR